MKHLSKAITLLFISLPLAAGCNIGGGAGKPTGPCAGAAALSKIVVLEVDGSPDDAKEGIKFMKTLESELASECTAKGYDKTAKTALACYEKNKKKIGYRVLKGCDEEVGKKLVAAVVAKHKK